MCVKNTMVSCGILVSLDERDSLPARPDLTPFALPGTRITRFRACTGVIGVSISQARFGFRRHVGVWNQLMLIVDIFVLKSSRGRPVSVRLTRAKMMRSVYVAT
jgi:hypothetical protein